ncbi:heme oxygenase (biliverdin-producing) [Mycolicibacterium vaccae]|uniref:biliverdin-producing heme oxygenase n=1 Tax=Mycolicibacterium vaccae TaxID=1810 RepID=UPI003CF1942B
MGRRLADPPRSLSQAMNMGSATEHEAAEQSPFLTELLTGQVGRHGYAAYLVRLRSVYDALETAARSWRDDPLVAAVYDPALERVGAIDTDLQYWSSGSRCEVDSPAVQRYRERLGQLSWGGAVVAHHYTRYLGDLSGGQAMATLLDREFGLDGAGLAFYQFGFRVKPYKDSYHARLDDLGLGPKETDAVVAEVKVAFGLNQELLDELGTELPDHRR